MKQQSLFTRTANRLVDSSPRQNWHWLTRKLGVRSSSPAVVSAPTPAVVRNGPAPDTVLGNWVISDLALNPVFPKLVAHRFSGSPKTIVLAGNPAECSALEPTLTAQGHTVRTSSIADVEANFDPPAGDWVLLDSSIPEGAEYWERTDRLKARFGAHVFGLQELVLPYTAIQCALANLTYSKQRGLEEIAPLYLGERYFGPLDQLDRLFPLKGKSVIEFGPMEGYQTAGLVALGASRVVAVEARAENYIKTQVARFAFNWSGVELVMDDFNNADKTKYGRFDLAFAHGVYYHSVAPFLFFENLISLSDTIFIGGLCASDTLPTDSYKPITFQGRSYRVKVHAEGNYFSSGINKFSYYFDGQDLMRFFSERAYTVTVISDEPRNEWAGRYLRFLAQRSTPNPAP